MLNRKLKQNHNQGRSLIEEIIEKLNLNLTGAVIITEMASNHFIYTPFIAALAGARKVIAVTKDSQFGSADEIINQGIKLALEWNLDQVISVKSLNLDYISEADIITNLGFVRPISRSFIDQMKTGAVIAHMSEAWEYRPGDIDLKACRKNDIAVMGTNEKFNGLKIFESCGPLLGKIMFEADLEIKGKRYLILSRDAFGITLSNYLNINGADAILLNNASDANRISIEGFDGIIIADYHSHHFLIGKSGWITPEQLANASPNTIVLQFVGSADVKYVQEAGLVCIPNYSLESHRMWRTLSYLGPKPVIELHTAGLKVGELMWNLAKRGLNSHQIIRKLGIPAGLCQTIDY